MSLTVQHLSLSALNPVQMSYNLRGSTEEPLAKNYSHYNQLLRCYDYDVLDNLKDVAVSKSNVIVLTDVKDLQQVFDAPISSIENSFVTGNCYLNVQNPSSALNENVRLCYMDQYLYAGGKGEEAVFTLFSVDLNKIRIKVGNKFLRVSATYPYEVILTESIDYNQIDYYTFTVQIYNNNLAIQANTPEGKRFLSPSKHDRKFRAVGLQLNSAIINQYLLQAEFLTNQIKNHGFHPTIFETKYFNNLEEDEQKTVNLKSKTESNTNLLLTMPASNFFSEKASVNISILKTQFSEVGTFNSSI